MKRILIGAALALSLLPGFAFAATYSLTTTIQQEAAITDARTRYNNSLPQTVCDSQGQNCVVNPALIATNGAYMLQVLTNAIVSWNSRPTQLNLDLATKTALITLLTADVARNDANSPAAQTALTALQNAQ